MDILFENRSFYKKKLVSKSPKKGIGYFVSLLNFDA